MKKISPAKRVQLIRFTRTRTARHLKRSEKNRIRKCLKCNGTVPVNAKSKHRIRIIGPQILGIRNSTSRRCLSRFIKELSNITLKNKQRAHIDFTHSRDAEAFGMLRMLAEIDRILKTKGKKTITATPPNDPVAAQVFHQIGLADILKIKRKPIITSTEVNYWHYIHGNAIEGDKAGRLILTLASEFGLDEQAAESLYAGASEAITNTVMHAYPQTPLEKGNWWMFAGIKESNLTVILCDVGIGIPISLKKKREHFTKRIVDLIANQTDSKLIEIAMTEGESISNKAHRGLGMVELKKLITTIGKGNLTIMSNKGILFYQGEDQKTEIYDHRTSINGTTVGWIIPIESLTV
ncbi:MAG: hypothetical protein JZU49_02710 [Sulfuricurvum sp.]|nr:hypothetical protein [Sulfuricurvum sp.]